MDDGEASAREYQTGRDAILGLSRDVSGARLYMPSVLPLRAAITRGALITLANWPTVLIDFLVESIYNLALAVPVIGGAFMLALLLGADIRTLLADGVLVAADRVLGALGQAPTALLAFSGALGLVGFVGAILMFIVKSGTLAVLVQGERTAGEIQRAPIRLSALRTAAAYSLESVLRESRRFQRRAVLLAAWLGAVYVLVGSAYVMAVNYGFQWAAASRWAPAWPLLVVIATSIFVVSLIAANLIFDLMRVVIVTDDCRVSEAARRVRTFLLADARQVLGIFGVMAVLLFGAHAAALVGTAGLSVVAWAPFVGIIVLPLQLAFWIVRGLFFQYAALATLSAYQTQYRRFAAPKPVAVPAQVHGA